MTTRGRIVAAVLGLAAGAAAVVILYSRTATSPPSPAETAPVRSLILFTVDTLRADRVGAYGWRAARTPAIDGLAARGVRFDRAYAATPITLPSHASLLTGLYPPGHGSRHNGMSIRTDVATLATVLREQGWATGAFVGAFPLDRQFGLGRGFDRYGDRMPRGRDGRLANERSGGAVVDEALDWLRGAGDRRVFLWVHLFEPHAPYEPDPARGPDGATLPAAVRYDDEVARADAGIGQLLAGLGDRASTALIVVAGDHGEAFGEHGEFTHSLFLYDTTLRVPLLVAGPGTAGASPVVGEPVSLLDVFPTVIDMLGLPRRDSDGLSLLPLLRGGTLGPRHLFAETFAPLLDFGWSSLRSVRAGQWKYVAAPRPEIYDIDRDPGENNDLASAQPEAARVLADRIDKYAGPELPRADGAGAPDRDAQARLAALGYVSAGRAGVSAARPDPKDRRELAARMALVVSGELQGAPLRQALEAIVSDDPGNGQAHMRLGYALIDDGEMRRAEPHFRAAIAAAVPTADAHLGLAMCLSVSGRLDEVSRVLTEARRLEPGNPVVEANLGSVAMDLGDISGAIGHLASALAVDPDLHQARFNLARAMARAGRRAEAEAQARDLLSRLPADAPQRSEVERLLRTLQQ